MELSQRILRGREAEYTLQNETLNKAFDLMLEKWMRGIVRAKPNENESIIEAKRRIDAIQDVRATLKSWVEDGELARIQQEEDDNE